MKIKVRNYTNKVVETHASSIAASPCHTVYDVASAILGDYYDGTTVTASASADPEAICSAKKTAWDAARSAVPDINWSSTALTKEEKLVVMGEKDTLSPANWATLVTAYGP